MPRSFRPATYLRPRREGTTARKLAGLNQHKVKIESVPGLVLGKGITAIVGAPGQFKTTLGLKIISCLRPSLMFAFEETFSETLADRLRHLEIRFDDLFIEVPSSVREAYGMIDVLKPRALLVDSLRASTFTMFDFVHLAQARNLIILIIQHLTKDGKVGGEIGIEYDADVVLRLSDGKWKLTKSRFQELTSGAVKEVAV